MTEKYCKVGSSLEQDKWLKLIHIDTICFKEAMERSSKDLRWLRAEHKDRWLIYLFTADALVNNNTKERITWPLDGDAGLVFRSAHFAKYFTILSVKFESLCIRPIMSTKADKGDRKREIEQSPMKKKFRDSAISSEELDSAIASRIELAFKEHQSTLNSVVNSAVRDAVDSVLIPALRELREDILVTNKSVRELREELRP